MKKSLAIFSTIILSSCTWFYYPTVTNAPLPEEKGNYHEALSIASNGFDLQGSYAFSDHFVALINANMSHNLILSVIGQDEFLIDLSTELLGCWNMNLEVGAGLYQRTSSKFRFELIGGVGTGISKWWDNFYFLKGDTDIAKTFYYKPFLQADFGYKLKKSLLGISLKTSALNEYENRYYGERFIVDKFHLFLEPAVFVRFENLQIQAGFSYCFGESFKSYTDYTQPFVFGVSYYINNK
jgi:hypothetical protein